MRLPRELIRAVPWPDQLRFDCSPIQEGLAGSPWHVVVASILLCRAKRDPSVLEDLLTNWSTPDAMARSDTSQLEEVLKPIGLHRNRARFLQQLSVRWDAAEGWSDLRDLNGVGYYVADAVGLFCFGCTKLDSTDGVLAAHAAQYTGPKLFSPIGGLYTVNWDGVGAVFDNPADAVASYRWAKYGN